MPAHTTLIPLCHSLLARASTSRDNFNKFAIQVPAALYARRGVTELVDKLIPLNDRIEAGASTLSQQICTRLQDLLQSVDSVCDDLDKSEETTDFENLGIVRVDLHKRSLEIALEVVNLSIRVHSIQVQLSQDTQTILVDTARILQNIVKVQASITRIHSGRLDVTESTTPITRFLQSAVTYLHIQQDPLGAPDPPDDAASQTSSSSSSVQSTYLYDIPCPSDDKTLLSFPPPPLQNQSFVLTTDNNRLVFFRRSIPQGQPIHIPAHCFGTSFTLPSPDGNLVLRGDEDSFSLYSITPSLRLVGTGDCGCILHLKHPRRKHKLWKPAASNSSDCSVFSADSKLFALAFNDSAALAAAAATAATATATATASGLTSAEEEAGSSWTIRVWKIYQDKCKMEEISKVKGTALVGVGYALVKVGFSPDGRTLAAVSCKQGTTAQAGSPGMSCSVWDVASGSYLGTFTSPLEMTEPVSMGGGAGVHSLELDGRWVLGIWLKRTARVVIWDVETGKIVFDRNPPFLASTVAKEKVHVGIAARGANVLAVRGSRGSLQVWDVSHSQMLRAVQDPEWMYEEAFLSADGRYLVARAELKFQSVANPIGRVWKLVQ